MSFDGAGMNGTHTTPLSVTLEPLPVYRRFLEWRMNTMTMDYIMFRFTTRLL